MIAVGNASERIVRFDDCRTARSATSVADGSGLFRSPRGCHKSDDDSGRNVRACNYVGSVSLAALFTWTGFLLGHCCDSLLWAFRLDYESRLNWPTVFNSFLHMGKASSIDSALFIRLSSVANLKRNEIQKVSFL